MDNYYIYSHIITLRNELLEYELGTYIYFQSNKYMSPVPRAKYLVGLYINHYWESEKSWGISIMNLIVMVVIERYSFSGRIYIMLYLVHFCRACTDVMK